MLLYLPNLARVELLLLALGRAIRLGRGESASGLAFRLVPHRGALRRMASRARLHHRADPSRAPRTTRTSPLWIPDSREGQTQMCFRICRKRLAFRDGYLRRRKRILRRGL